MSVINFDEDNMNIVTILNNNIDIYTLLYFTATWCGPCKKVMPIIKDKFTKINNMSIYQIDIDENDKLVKKYDIKSVPTFIMIKNNIETMEYNGSDSIKLLTMIKSIYDNNN
jgi:thioredoxin 1